MFVTEETLDLQQSELNRQIQASDWQEINIYSFECNLKQTCFCQDYFTHQESSALL